MCTYILDNFTKNSLLDILMVTISFKFIFLNILMQCITHATLQTFTYSGCRFECYGHFNKLYNTDATMASLSHNPILNN